MYNPIVWGIAGCIIAAFFLCVIVLWQELRRGTEAEWYYGTTLEEMVPEWFEEADS